MQVSFFTSSINGSRTYQERIHNIAAILFQIEIHETDTTTPIEN